MLITHAEPFQQGLDVIIDRDGPDGDVLMDFGVITLAPGQAWSAGAADEKALLLMSGAVDLAWSSARTGEGGRASASRTSLFDQDPAVLHLPDGFAVSVTAGPAGAELTWSATANPRPFPARFHAPADCRSEERGKGTMRETSTRVVRTVFDDSSAPAANLVIGEVVTAPGKWSSYPPHHHPQPEIYHYRFLPEQGFGLTAIGQDTHTLRHQDTVIIRDTQDHPQVAAPGYAMWYVWIIRHLDGNRYTGPTFTPEHTWVQHPAAPIWAPPSER